MSCNQRTIEIEDFKKYIFKWHNIISLKCTASMDLILVYSSCFKRNGQVLGEASAMSVEELSAGCHG